MATLTGHTVASRYGDYLQVSNVGNGVDATLRPVESGLGNTSPLQLSTTAVNINSGWQIGGVPITVGTAALNALSGTNTGDQTITLTGEATGSGTGSFATTLSNAAVIAKVLTAYAAGAGTVAATDTILQAIQKLDGNDGLAVKKASNGSDFASAATTRSNLGLSKTGISFHFPSTSATNATYVLASSARVACTINSLKNLKTASGTITAKLQINGADITGLTGLSVTSTPQSPNASAANTIAVGDRLTLVLSANSTATDLEGEIEVTI